uniref:Terpenoid synthase n=1 Tax=Moniliophthora roreri TaxID=221103 RepID=A0A0W0G0P8_MONRR
MPIDVSVALQNFCTFSAVMHVEEPQIAATQRKIRKVFQPYMLKSLHARHYSEGPHGNLYDDVTEALPRERAGLEHEIAEHGSLTSRVEVKSCMANYFRDLAGRMMTLDLEGAPFLIGQLHQHFSEYDKRSAVHAFLSFSLFMPSPANSCIHSECSLPRPLCLGKSGVGPEQRLLVNERREENDVDEDVPIPNAVSVIMRQYGMKEKDAKLLLKGMIVEEEQIVRKLGMGILKGEISKNVRNLVVRVYFVLGANGFWSSTCPRYNGSITSLRGRTLNSKVSFPRPGPRASHEINRDTINGH